MDKHVVEKSEFPPNLEGLTKYWKSPPPENTLAEFVLFRMNGSDFAKETWSGFGEPGLMHVANLFWKLK